MVPEQTRVSTQNLLDCSASGCIGQVVGLKIVLTATLFLAMSCRFCFVVIMVDLSLGLTSMNTAELQKTAL